MDTTIDNVAIRHEWRTVNGVRLHCAVAGAGPLVILLHGFPEFWYSWRHQMPVLAQQFTVVAPDMRGYNLSDKPKQLEAYEFPMLVEDVVQLIRSFGYDQAIVAGHDWGAAIAWETAMTRPEVVQKLIILNVPHPRLFVQNLLTNPRQMLRSWYMGFFQLPWLPEAVFKANNYRAIEQAFRSSAVYRQRFDDQAIEHYKQAAAQPGALTAAINYYRANARGGMQKLAGVDPVVRVPTMVVWGEQDFALGKELNDRLEHYVPNLRLHYISDASHWVQQDRPDLVNQYLLDFLAEHQ